VLSREGRTQAAERWYEDDFGPDTPMARQAPAPCGTCGFLVQLAGSLRAGFGACANELSPADGRVVSVEYGCGAHSEALPPIEDETVEDDHGDVYDDAEIEIVDVHSVDSGGEQLAELVEQDGVDAEPDVVDPFDADDAGAVDAGDEPAGLPGAVEQIPEPEIAQPDGPAEVAGEIEQPTSGDAG
jgi:hypothetical protein